MNLVRKPPQKPIELTLKYEQTSTPKIDTDLSK
jgi:hypothetical protein